MMVGATLDGIPVSEYVMGVAERIYRSKLGRAPRWERMHPKECAFWFARAQEAIDAFEECDAYCPHHWAVFEYVADELAREGLRRLHDGAAPFAG